MTIQELTKALSKIKKGAMTKVCYKTTKGNYSKETETIVRFVQDSHIKGVQAKGKTNPNESVDNLGIIFNKNTNKFYLQMATIKTKTKAKVKYYLNGVEIDKASYELANPPRPNTQPLIVFRKDINDIISLG